jgi:hypothetical protein
MRKLIWGLIGIGALCLVAGLAPATASAESGVKVGFLTCEVSSGFGFIFGSSRDLDCTYSGVDGKKVNSYKGTISTFGADIGYIQGGIIAWGVIAPTTDVKPGALEGQYAGVSASATVGAGVGANVLVGGLNKSISLQPVSVQGTTGLNAAAGITTISLTAVK